MSGFNLSEWAVRHRSLVVYFMLVLAVAGVGSYLRLGRSEDPSFTIRTMVVQAKWPGAGQLHASGQREYRGIAARTRRRFLIQSPPR